MTETLARTEAAPPNVEKLEALLRTYSNRADTGQVSFALASPSRGWAWSFESESEPKPYFTASITKLYTTAVVMQLRQENLLALDDPIADHLDAAIVAGLNIYGGKDHSSRITVRHLLSHTSGIAGYFDQKRRDGGTMLADILKEDRAWSVEEALDIAKNRMPARFAPGTAGKAFYSDTNFHLLGLVIEKLTGTSWEQAVTDRILVPLSLANTRPFTRGDVAGYDGIAPMLYGRKPVRIPLAMTSVNAHGGLVSTADDGVVFLKAFMAGELFDAAYLDEMQRDWNRIFFPLQYGMGLMRYSMSKWMSPGPAPREYVGHSGSSGTVLFHAPAADLYVSGNVSQLKNRALVYQLTSRLGALPR